MIINVSKEYFRCVISGCGHSEKRIYDMNKHFKKNHPNEIMPSADEFVDISDVNLMYEFIFNEFTNYL